MKNIDIIVEVRSSSKRLPNKGMLKVLGRPLLDLMIERLKKIKLIKNIIIATTKNKVDDKIIKLAKKNKIKYFRGEENDVLKRVVKCVSKNKTDIIVQITGDNPLVDMHITEKMIKFFIKNSKKYDIVLNDCGYVIKKFKKYFSLGLNTKVFSSSLLFEIEKKTKDPIEREHVILHVLKNHKKYRIHNFKLNKKYHRPDLRFTMDYIEDYKVIKLIYENLYSKNKNFSALDIFDFLDRNPNIKKINSVCIQKNYNL